MRSWLSLGFDPLRKSSGNPDDKGPLSLLPYGSVNHGHRAIGAPNNEDDRDAGAGVNDLHIHT
jgi:hypothetical protein